MSETTLDIVRPSKHEFEEKKKKFLWIFFKTYFVCSLCGEEFSRAEMLAQKDDECSEEKFTVEIEYEISGDFYRGYRNSLGVPEEPDEEPEVEITSVIGEGDKTATQIELTESEKDEVASKIMEGVRYQHRHPHDCDD